MTAPGGNWFTRASAAAGRAVVALAIPTSLRAERANRRINLPTISSVDGDITAQMQNPTVSYDTLAGPERELVVLAVAQDRERVTGLEAKGFASLTLPLGVITLAVLLLPHLLWPTVIASVAMMYAGCAVLSAALVVRPTVRAVFLVEHSAEPDALGRLVAVSKVNRLIATSVQNRVWAALMDTLRSAVLVLAAAIFLLAQRGADRQTSPAVAPASPSASTPTTAATATPKAPPVTPSAPAGGTPTPDDTTQLSLPPTASTVPSASG